MSIIPILLLNIMTILFHDMHEGDTQNLIPTRMCGKNVDRIVYADDTSCVSTDRKSMNMFMKDKEHEGLKYGLRLSKGKCELLTTSLNADIKFADLTNVENNPKVTYLGC